MAEKYGLMINKRFSRVNYVLYQDSITYGKWKENMSSRRKGNDVNFPLLKSLLMYFAKVW